MKLEELQKQFEDTIEIEENEVLEEKHTDKKSKRKWVFLILVVVLLGIVSILVKQKFLSAPIPEEEKTATAEGAIEWAAGRYERGGIGGCIAAEN